MCEVAARQKISIASSDHERVLNFEISDTESVMQHVE